VLCSRQATEGVDVSEAMAGGGVGLGVGSAGFVEAHGLHSPEQREAATAMAARIRELGLRTVRLILVDQHGVPRGKHLSGEAAIAALRNGADFSGAIFSLDTGNQVFPPAFVQGGGFGIDEFTGFPDIVIVPDPATFRVLPFADRTGWVICDAYFSNGKPIPLVGRHAMKAQLERLRSAGYSYLAGLEVEFYITRLAHSTIGHHETGQPGLAPEVEVFQRGYQFLSDARLDGIASTLEAIRDALWDVGLQTRSIEDEWGPGQIEFTFSPLPDLEAADAMVLFRSVVKAVCVRRGLHASFMCWPNYPNFFPNGWHLHESLIDSATGQNAFAHATEIVSPLAAQFVAGLLEHAKEMALFGNPTVNGYPRLRPYSFAPDRIAWAAENRGALIRIQGGPGEVGTHVENRLSEPAANPYFWMAANIAAGLDGIERGLTPPPMVTGDPYAEDAELLPQSLGAAVDALDGSSFYRRVLGASLIDYLVMMKRFEVNRHAEAVAAEPLADGAVVHEWEMREYFESF
jgi:glutamine synthetase